ncbi:MAG: hypothetical protein FJX45_04835 [Alphaproteobacteria bacterium]|nr:hypothetical protein [Alphaproteobacteria bacterium]MBM3651580.1 hypothetical protein [Alphaproteobacteria bacterium]
MRRNGPMRHAISDRTARASFPTRATRAIGNPEQSQLFGSALDSRSGLRPAGNDKPGEQINRISNQRKLGFGL